MPMSATKQLVAGEGINKGTIGRPARRLDGIQSQSSRAKYSTRNRHPGGHVTLLVLRSLICPRGIPKGLRSLEGHRCLLVEIVEG